MTSLVTGATAGLEDTAGAKAAVEARHHRGIAPSRTADRIREVAERLRYSTPTRLYAADSDLFKAIVRNFNKSGRNHWWRTRGARVPDDSVIRKTLEESLALEVSGPVHRSASALGFQTEDPLTRRFPDLCRAIKAKRAEVWAARRNALPLALEGALREDPPPPLEQIAARLGYTSDTSIRGWEPRLCAKLTAKRHDFAERCVTTPAKSFIYY